MSKYSIYQMANHEMPVKKLDESAHLSGNLDTNPQSQPIAQTKYGPVKGGRVPNSNTNVWLTVPYGLTPKRWQDPIPLPSDYKYDSDKNFVHNEGYCYQTSLDGQGPGVHEADKCGLGKRTEDLQYVHIIAPSDAFENNKLKKKSYPVNVYLHGGYLQWGGAGGIKHQAQYVSEERKEIRVNIGYRVNIFGFLTAEKPFLSGNYGFKDQWLALEWVQENIASFGGNPDEVKLSGLSAGAHSVHQILHHASRLNTKAPFSSAHLISNAILTDPKKPKEGQFQYDALVKYFNLSGSDEEILDKLCQVPGEEIIKAIENYGTSPIFRSTTDGEWMQPGATEWQSSGEFGRKLKENGVKYIITGQTRDEWFLYALLHVAKDPSMVRQTLEWCYPPSDVEKLMKFYGPVKENADFEDCQKYIGEAFADGQVHLPTRILVKDLIKSGMPVVHYESRFATADSLAVMHNTVTHGSDLSIWFLRGLTDEQYKKAVKFLDAVDEAAKEVQVKQKPIDQVLTITEDLGFEWRKDWKLERMNALEKALRG